MKKVIGTICLLIVLLLIAAGWYYRTIQSDFYSENDKAARLALSETSLKKADRVEYFAGEHPYRIVYGVNEDNRKLIIWVGNGEVHEELASAGVSRVEVKQLVQLEHGNVDFKRIVPGKLGENYVWEVFFVKDDPDGKRHYYEYYRFQDGERLDTLRLKAE